MTYQSPFPEPDTAEEAAMIDRAKQASAAPPAVPKASQEVLLRAANGLQASTTAEQLRDLTLEQLQSFFGASLVDASDAIGTDQYGPILESENKGILIGKPCLFVHWNFYQGDIGEYVSVWVLTRNDDGSEQRYLVNDGSTGIYAQLRELTDEKGIDSGLLVKHGLRVSVYDKEMLKPDGSKVLLKDCKTYYVDTKL